MCGLRAHQIPNLSRHIGVFVLKSVLSDQFYRPKPVMTGRLTIIHNPQTSRGITKLVEYIASQTAQRYFANNRPIPDITTVLNKPKQNCPDRAVDLLAERPA